MVDDPFGLGPDGFGGGNDDVFGSGDSFNLDLSEVESNTVAPGKYTAKVVGVEQQYSQAGNPMLIWRFQVDQGEYAGRSLRMRTVITPKAMWKVATVVEALQLGKQGQKVNFKREDAIGRRCVIVVTEREYEGRIFADIAATYQLPEGEPLRVADGQPI